MATTQEPPSPAAEPPTPPHNPEQRFALPRSAYLWLAVILLTYVISGVVERAPRRVMAGAAGGVSAGGFSKYVIAEAQTRAAFGISALGALGGPAASATVERQREDALKAAVRQYRALLGGSVSPNLPRRILILDHARGAAYDEKLVSEELAPALRAAKKSDAEVREERALWRDLYQRQRVRPADVGAYERRIRAMNLRFLEDRALADLYRAAGDSARADQYAARLQSRAAKSVLQTGALNLLQFAGVMVGVVLLFLFLHNARKQRWERVRRVATEPQRMGWGALLDAFLFYLALYTGIGLLAGVAAGASGIAPSPRGALALSAAMQFGTGAVAFAYLLAAAKRRGATLADIGLTAPGSLWGNVGYGVLGYLAILPLVIGLGLLSQAIFRDAPNTSPNPILPLILSERAPLWRFVIFTMVAVGAPFFEELFFRGALFTGLRTRFTWVPAALLSATLFALLHPMQDWLPIIGLGFGFGAMREMRQSLVPSITAHLLQNGMSFLTLSLLFGS